MLLLVPIGCASEGRYIAYDDAGAIESRSRVVTFVDFFEAGRAAVADYLEALPAEERAEIEQMLERSSQACARLAIIVSRHGMNYSQVSGSAVLVRAPGGDAVRLATAGHSFEAGAGEVRVTLRDGRKVTTTSLEREFAEFDSGTGDWAVLDVKTGRNLPAIPFRKPRAGELAFVLAYPNQMGINRDGRIVYGNAYAGDPLAPIVTIARVDSTDPLNLDPIAGSLEMGGASGGAIVNRDGELIGVLSGSGWVPGKDGASYWIRGATVAAFAKLLEPQE